MKENIKGLNFSSDVTLAESYEKYIDEINSLIEKAEKCQQLINSYDKVTDDEYYNEIKSFPYGTKLNHSDYFKII